MTASNFKLGLTYVLAFEGGYVNHPKDPGGATNKGITQNVYDAYRRVLGLPTQSVAGISSGEAAAIYRQQYWQAILGDKLPTGVDYALFDFAVNSGVSRAVKTLQSVLGVDADGHMGFVTMSRLDSWQPERLIVDLCERRIKFVKGLETFDTFGKGWLRRIQGNKAGAQPGNDNGVIDYATNMLKPIAVLPLPKSIGALINEPQTAKAA